MALGSFSSPGEEGPQTPLVGVTAPRWRRGRPLGGLCGGRCWRPPCLCPWVCWGEGRCRSWRGQNIYGRLGRLGRWRWQWVGRQWGRCHRATGKEWPALPLPLSVTVICTVPFPLPVPFSLSITLALMTPCSGQVLLALPFPLPCPCPVPVTVSLPTPLLLSLPRIRPCPAAGSVRGPCGAVSASGNACSSASLWRRWRCVSGRGVQGMVALGLPPLLGLRSLVTKCHGPRLAPGLQHHTTGCHHIPSGKDVCGSGGCPAAGLQGPPVGGLPRPWQAP